MMTEKNFSSAVEIDSKSLTIEQIVDVARDNHKVVLSKSAIDNIKKGEELVKKFVSEGKVAYGITTGFGALWNKVIPQTQVRQLQKNLIMSHATCVGEPFPEEVVRAIMLLRANTLASGHCGIRLSTVQTLLDMLNAGIHPYIPQKGSVGSSGDLAPLAHLALVIIGMGKAYYKGELISGLDALKKANIKPVVLEAKEGLALINGTQAMTAVGTLTVYDAEILLKSADIIAAMTLDALKCTDHPFDERIHNLRKYKGQSECAANLRNLLKGSEIRKSHEDCSRILDPYSMRCTPQVHGASRDAVEFVKGVINIEINSVTDNPLLFPDSDEFLLDGNFHGQPVALAMDYLGIALSEIANISERRIERLLNPRLNKGLPGFLAKESGLNSGFMIAQYTAASLVSENKILAHPASVDSIPTSAGHEDHVSMGTTAARKANEILFNAENVLAIELLCAAQGLDFIKEFNSSQSIQAVRKIVRNKISHLDKDRVLYHDINAAQNLIKEGNILKSVEKKIDLK